MKVAAPNPKRIRTLQLGMSWLPEQAGNGLDRVYHALACNLPRAGVEVDGLVVGSENVTWMSGRCVRAFAAPATPLLWRLAAARCAVREALTRQPDLVVVHFALYGLPTLDLLHGRPVVVHFHGPWAHESEIEGAGAVAVRVKAAVEKLVYSRAKLFIVLSQAFADVLRDRYGVNESQIRIVPGGVDADRFRGAMSKQEARRNLGWPQDRPVLLSVRRLYQRMGLENLIDAFQVAHRTAPDALLYIAGKGPLAASLQARIDASGLGQSVRLLGYLSEEELPLAYCAANVSVVPTLALEGFGLITVESLASGTPVLVTPVGGLPEVVGNLSPDLILPDTSAATMAERLTMFLRGGLALPDAETCRRYAREQFDWSVIAQRTKQVYEEALYG